MTRFALNLPQLYRRIVRPPTATSTDLPFVLPLFDGTSRRTDDSFLGTGLLIAPQFVLTCYHVVAEFCHRSASGKPDSGIRTYVGEPHQVVTASVVKADSALDLALLRLDAPLDGLPSMPFLMNLNAVFIERIRSWPLFASGYAEHRSGGKQTLHSLAGLKTTGVHSGSGTIEDLQADGGVPTGFSGGPALVRLPGGALACLGLVFLGGERSSTTRIRPTDVLLEFIRSVDAHPKIIDARTVPRPSRFVGVRSASVLVAVLLLLGSASVLSYQRLSKNLRPTRVSGPKESNDMSGPLWDPAVADDGTILEPPDDVPYQPPDTPSHVAADCIRLATSTDRTQAATVTVINDTSGELRIIRYLHECPWHENIPGPLDNARIPAKSIRWYVHVGAPTVLNHVQPGYGWFRVGTGPSPRRKYQIDLLPEWKLLLPRGKYTIRIIRLDTGPNNLPMTVQAIWKDEGAQ